ncbi:GatB/YqeY domain-containing protein [Lagierella sp.]|uniref:GatB/YqeY domain-containing protein n=1 Tax=Lagierella sp. TaxID=2849657 RepID=UPI00260E670F|nr:GatB/YqeY domain-containing protein [Lagierella sp.]
MSFLERLRKDKMKALKDKDKLKVNVVTLLMSSIALEEKESKKELTDEQAIKFVQKELKQLKDTLDQTPEDREDIISETEDRIRIVESYLPKQAEPEEIDKEIISFIESEGLSKEPKNKGIIIKHILGKFGAKTDGKTVNGVVDKVLKN